MPSDAPTITTGEIIAQVLTDHPDVTTELDSAERAAWSCVDPVLLELCRLRIAMLLDAESEAQHRTGAAIDAGLHEARVAELAQWPTSARFDDTERACLAFTEQFVLDVAGMDDATADAVGAALGPNGLADFVAALLVVEQRQRLRLIWSRFFSDVTP